MYFREGLAYLLTGRKKGQASVCPLLCVLLRAESQGRCFRDDKPRMTVVRTPPASFAGRAKGVRRSHKLLTGAALFLSAVRGSVYNAVRTRGFVAYSAVPAMQHAARGLHLHCIEQRRTVMLRLCFVREMCGCFEPIAVCHLFIPLAFSLSSAYRLVKRLGFIGKALLSQQKGDAQAVLRFVGLAKTVPLPSLPSYDG